mgnify:CR=1 FL=1
MVDIEATIICERDSHKGIIIGKGGAMLKKIGSNARFELERMLDSKVNLKLWGVGDSASTEGLFFMQKLAAS